ncbi:hypothetical protein KKA00_07955 [bacterium]|nr:hypothetical protein [bacterium]MBU1652139.1 hypothetical protein [bacterium]
MKIINNSFYHCEYGMSIGGISIVNNNILISGSEIGLWNAQVNPLYVPIGDYNCVWNWGSANYNDRWNFGDHSFSLDPLFADTVAFRLMPNSPCIDTGDPSLFDPDGSRSDIGAWGGPNAY